MLPCRALPLLADGRAIHAHQPPARYQRWLKLTEEGKELCRFWKKWLTEQVRKYEWDIDPEESNNPTIHGLRGAALLVRRLAGRDIDQIGNDIGMSRQMVEPYMRFRDQVEVAAAGRARLESSLRSKGWTVNRQTAIWALHFQNSGIGLERFPKTGQKSS